MQQNAPFYVLLGGGGGGLTHPDPPPPNAFSLSRVGMYVISTRPIFLIHVVCHQFYDNGVGFVEYV